MSTRERRAATAALLGAALACAAATGGAQTYAGYSDFAVAEVIVGAGVWAPDPPKECGPLKRYTGGVVYGTTGDDVLRAVKKPQVLMGLDGDDELYGDGNDCVVGGPGEDCLRGDDDDDILVWGPGDRCLGEDDDDDEDGDRDGDRDGDGDDDDDRDEDGRTGGDDDGDDDRRQGKSSQGAGTVGGADHWVAPGDDADHDETEPEADPKVEAAPVAPDQAAPAYDEPPKVVDPQSAPAPGPSNDAGVAADATQSEPCTDPVGGESCGSAS